MLTASAFLLPSVPTMLIDEQRGDYTEMIEAVTAAGDRTLAESPAAIVALSSHWRSTSSFLADDGRRHRSVIDLPGFGVEPRHDCAGRPALARALVAAAAGAGVRAACARHGLDSGVTVPLHFFARARRVPVVPVSVGEGPPEEHRAWGAALRAALEARAERVAFVAGGALSFSLHDFNLKRDVPEAVELDQRVLAALARGAWDEIAALPARLRERARPDADLRHLEVLRGFLGGGARGETIAHETSPGVGTALVEFLLAPPGGAGRGR